MRFYDYIRELVARQFIACACRAMNHRATDREIMQRTLVLVKHSLPTINEGVPAREWSLSGEGRARCISLAKALSQYLPFSLYSSIELKAQETAQFVAESLSLSKQMQVVEGLHEHDRRSTPFLGAPAFEYRVRTFFTHPNELVFGQETAQDALERFSKSITSIITSDAQENIVIVAHGTVITLFTAHYVRVEPFPLWQSLQLPSFVTFSLPSYTLQSIVPQVLPE